MKKPIKPVIEKPASKPVPPEKQLIETIVLKDFTFETDQEISGNDFLNLTKNHNMDEVFIENYPEDYDFSSLKIVVRKKIDNPNFEKEMENYKFLLKTYNEALEIYKNKRTFMLEYEKKLKEYEIWLINQKLKVK